MSMVYSGDSIQDTDGGVLRPISSVMRNRIINGAMVIDQRNAGASVTVTSTNYSVDRWAAFGSVTSKYTVQQNAGSVTPPSGFRNYMGFTSSSAYTVGASENFRVQQPIEGFNTSDFMWGTANATNATLSFWVRSSLTGTFGGAFVNENADRSYPFTFTISAANTWEYKTITVAGDTTGTWAGATNGIGIRLYFNLGAGSSVSGTANAWQAGFFTAPTGATSVVGTSGATFYITGVQLEVGTQATSFEYRQYQQELALCQRYYYKVKADASAANVFSLAYADSATAWRSLGSFPVTLRVAPSALEQSGTASDYSVRTGGVSRGSSIVPTFSAGTSQYVWFVTGNVASGQTAGLAGFLNPSNANAYLAWSAEL